MGAAKHIRRAMFEKDRKIGWLIDQMDMKPQALYNLLDRDTMSFKRAEEIADILDCDIVFVDRKSGAMY